MSKQRIRGLTVSMMETGTPTPMAQADTVTPQLEERHTTPSAQPVPRLTKAGFLVRPAALQQFDILKAELAAEYGRKDVGPRLLAEALNLLFHKHGKPPVPYE